MSGWVAGISAVASIAGSAMSSRAASKGANRSRAASAAMARLELDQGERQARIADQLEAMANKMLSGESLSPQDLSMINAAQTLASKQIATATKEGINEALGAQAGTGFLKSGRAAGQIRKLSLEGIDARSRLALQREQFIQQTIEGRRNQAISLLQGAGGMSITPTNIPQLASSGSLQGAALSSLGGAGLNLAGQMSGANSVANALAQQQFAGNRQGLFQASPPTDPTLAAIGKG